MPQVSSENRDKYRALLEEFRSQNSSDAIGNRYPWHCQIAIDELIEHALAVQHQTADGGAGTTTIRLLTSSCTDFVYGDKPIITKIKKFLTDGGSMKVLIWNKHHVGGQMMTQALTKRQSRGDGQMEALFSSFEHRYSGTSKDGERLRHFIVVGDRSYRLEAPHSLVECSEFTDFSPEIPARICFNDQDGAGELIDFFDDIWKAIGDSQDERATESAV